ncbi:hypothetical protein CAP35_10600 [Chitinophagaceae bacterium IBVUCB1]|nr:hypothetical protein CAP35_10600 [Chitinophagaceae bacterium IBVUCB1]
MCCIISAKDTSKQPIRDMKQKYFWLKLVGTAMLLHVLLILLSIIEVVIYSFLINPGHDDVFYEAHATRSAPWVSYIFGSLFVFLFVKRFVQRFNQQQLLYALALPIVYTIIDYIIISIAMDDTESWVTQFFIGSGLKILAGLIAYFIYGRKELRTP